jgi:hypothetical protein
MPPVSKPAPGFPLTRRGFSSRQNPDVFGGNSRPTGDVKSAPPDQSKSGSGNPIHFTGCFTTRASRLVWDIAAFPLAVLFSGPSMALALVRGLERLRPGTQGGCSLLNIRPVIMVAMIAGLELLGVNVPHFSGVDIGTLSTLSRKQPNVPFRSLMPFALDPAGRPPSSLAIWPCRPRI